MGQLFPRHQVDVGVLERELSKIETGVAVLSQAVTAYINAHEDQVSVMTEVVPFILRSVTSIHK